MLNKGCGDPLSRLVEEFSTFGCNNLVTTSEKWMLPSDNWLKGNIDASFRNDIAGCVVVLRDSKVTIVRISFKVTVSKLLLQNYTCWNGLWS